MTRETHSRRDFLTLAGAGAAASLAGPGKTEAMLRTDDAEQPIKRRFELGMASYTLRKFKLDQTLAITRRVGLKYIAFKSFHLALDSTPEQIAEAVKKVKDAGLILYGGGVIYMKNETEVNQAFEYAKAAGMKVIIGVPAHELLPLVNKKVREYDIKVAIHNHGPGDQLYPTAASAYEKIKNLDKRIGLCNDIGHTQRSGIDPSVSIRKYADRLLDVHIKDVSAAAKEGHGVEVGRGVIDIPRFLRTLVEIKYPGIVSFEYEKDADDPIAGLAESVGYVKGVLAAMNA
ncbi:MAG: sugar phosphate isomerase/epimerase [Sedimentisphaerales bacterium]|nr:sugar phosphate isomerase/epimerase [Sedimentisphaerales bacterium]